MSNARREIVKVLTYETMDPDQLEFYYPQLGRRGRSEYQADCGEYSPFKLYDQEVPSCHREKRK